MKKVEFYGELHGETDNAIKVFDGSETIWIPKSQVVEQRHIKGVDYEFEVTEWIAKQKGII
jgi:hypothetical protein